MNSVVGDGPTAVRRKRWEKARQGEVTALQRQYGHTWCGHVRMYVRLSVHMCSQTLKWSSTLQNNLTWPKPGLQSLRSPEPGVQAALVALCPAGPVASAVHLPAWAGAAPLERSSRCFEQGAAAPGCGEQHRAGSRALSYGFFRRCKWSFSSAKALRDGQPWGPCAHGAAPAPRCLAAQVSLAPARWWWWLCALPRAVALYFETSWL